MYLYLLPIPPLLMMVAGDIRRREIGVPWLTAFAVAVAIASLRADGVGEVARNALTNIGLLAYMFAGALFYIKVVKKGTRRSLAGYIGAGDLLFLLSLTPLAPLREFLLLLLASMLLSLLWWCARFIGPRRPTDIPFVATSGLAVGVFLIYLTL